MRSRPARLTLSVLAWFALGAAAFYAVQTYQQIGMRRAALRAFETTARDASEALADAQAGQQAYVAAGQHAGAWAPKVASYLRAAASGIDTLRAAATVNGSAQSLLDASTALTQLSRLDRRVQANAGDGNLESAAQVIFDDAADAVSNAVSNIDAAVVAEQQAADDAEQASVRKAAYATGGAVGFASLVLLLLAIASPRAAQAAATEDVTDAQPASSEAERLVPDSVAPSPASAPAPHDRSLDVLRSTAELCTEFSKVRDSGDLKALLSQASALMGARGIIVWLGSNQGADLRPVLAHGYSDQTLARIQTIPRDADNATADAYREGVLQTVKSRPGAAQGAVIAPLVAADGCIGALSAEVRDRGEESDLVRAVATIVAAQLAIVLGPTAAGTAAGSGADADADAGPGQATAAQ